MSNAHALVLGMLRLLTVAVASLVLSAAALAQTAPRFEDFAAKPDTAARAHKLRLTDAKSRKYATLLRDRSRRKSNFAGHYVLGSWGCGTSCVMTAAVDARSGDVVWLPFTVCCWKLDIIEPLDFKLDSRLLVVHGARDEQGNGTYYYDFDGKQFLLVKAEESPSLPSSRQGLR